MTTQTEAIHVAARDSRFLRALRREPVDRTPVWLMRQAGRYLPEYREVRQRAGSFLAMAKTPEIACEVTLQPLRRFPLDAAILFSDILTIPDAMGLGLYFAEGEGPKFERPLIGFSGSPWTLACYMVEGGGSRDFARIKAMAFDDPQSLHRLLAVATDAVIAYLAAQRAAGAQALQVFDTWGGVLSPAMYREFSLPYLRRIARELERGAGADRAPLILFGKGTAAYLGELADTGAEAVGVDWLVELGEAARRTGGRVAVQGNLDPTTLYGSPEAIRREVRRALDSWRDGNGGSREGHVFNLGHGMSPDMDPEHVAVLVEEVHAWSAR